MRSQIFRQIAQKFRRHTWCMARDFWAIWRKICKQIACKAVRRALCSVSLVRFCLYTTKLPQSRCRKRCLLRQFGFTGKLLGQYRTKIVRQMRRQIFRQMKQKAEWILDVFTSIFVKYESLFRIWRMQIASSDFLRDEGKNGENPLWIFEYFPEISRKICTQDACGKIRNRLWREICKQMACKVARRSLCGIAALKYIIDICLN